MVTAAKWVLGILGTLIAGIVAVVFAIDLAETLLRERGWLRANREADAAGVPRQGRTSAQSHEPGYDTRPRAPWAYNLLDRFTS